ncbi:VOC family protein [Halobacteriovorax sp. XZX-3]|uniref:VOC family protein n=1 Tax=unclassified Halobacteriovorax TaxID=2639665 RepID=UPI003721F1D7
MISPNLIILYVDDPLKSSEFYRVLLGQEPVGFPSYQCFELENGLNLGLWSTKAKNFVSGGEGHRTELAFQVESEDKVRELYEQWKSNDVKIEQELEVAVFGLTFVAVDPDGHRIRVNLSDS